MIIGRTRKKEDAMTRNKRGGNNILTEHQSQGEDLLRGTEEVLCLWKLRAEAGLGGIRRGAVLARAHGGVLRRIGSPRALAAQSRDPAYKYGHDALEPGNEEGGGDGNTFVRHEDLIQVHHSDAHEPIRSHHAGDCCDRPEYRKEGMSKNKLWAHYDLSDQLIPRSMHHSTARTHCTSPREWPL